MRFSRRVGIFVGVLALAISGCRSGNGGAEQLVQKDRATVYSAFANAFSDGAFNGASQYSNLWHGGMQTFVEKPSDTKLHVTVKFDGQIASKVQFTFTPENGGSATLVKADVNVDEAVMRKAFTGTPQEQMADVPEFAYVVGMQRLMSKYARRIETAEALNRPSEGWMTSARELPPEFYEGMPEETVAEIRRHEEAERQQAAAAPMIDPNADAQRALAAGGSSY